MDHYGSHQPLFAYTMPNTLAQLEAFVQSPHYDAATAAAIALRIPALPRLKGEQIAPGITRIHGNLCNVHGRYGRCPGAPAATARQPGVRKPRKPRKPKKIAQTPDEKRATRDAQHAQNRSAVLQSLNIAPDGQQALEALRSGQQSDGAAVARGGFEAAGLVERARDGSYRLSASGRAALSAASSGDAGRTGDIISSARDRATARGDRTQAASQRRQTAAAKREHAAQLRAKRQSKRASGGGKAPATRHSPPVPTPHRARHAGSTSGIGGSSSGGSTPKPRKPQAPRKPKPPKAEKPTKAQTAANNRQRVRDDMMNSDQGLAPAGFDNLIALGGGTEPDATGADGLISMHMAERGSDGTLRLTSAGRAAIRAANRGDAKAAIDVISRANEPKATKAFFVFKDATGRARWVAQSSTAYQDRDKEIVSTKAMADDCAESDRTGIYGPLRWWHTPGLDLGDCDFNAMHGRILIESGTFRSPLIAQKVAQAADALEISLGFLHLPTEPDASGVFHHMRKFERSLVPRGKASNLFTAFSVKERPMFDPTKVAALKALGFSDDDITGLQTQAEATEKAATDQQIAFKADEPPVDLPDLEINGVIYKAFPPKPDDAPDDDAAVVEEAAVDEMPMDEMADDAGGLTLSPEDIAAIGDAMGTALQAGIAQIMGALDLEKKVAGHVQGFMAPFQAQKDASDAEKAEQITALQASLKTTQDQLSELLGLQPASTPRATETRTTALNPFNPADNALLESIKEQIPQQYANGFEDLKQKLFGA